MFTTIYQIEATSPTGCVVTDSIEVVVNATPVVNNVNNIGEDTNKQIEDKQLKFKITI
jgi:hypothetical protein